MSNVVLVKKIVRQIIWNSLSPLLVYISFSIFFSFLADLLFRNKFYVSGIIFSILLLISILISLGALKLGIENIVRELKKTNENVKELVTTLKSNE